MAEFQRSKVEWNAQRKPLSYKGRDVPITRLIAKGEQDGVVAAGAGQWMNARGDYLTFGGKVMKTADELHEEYEAYRARVDGKETNSRSVSYKDPNSPLAKISPSQKVANPFARKFKKKEDLVDDITPKKIAGERAQEIIQDNADRSAEDTTKLEYKRKLVQSVEKDEGNDI